MATILCRTAMAITTTKERRDSLVKDAFKDDFDMADPVETLSTSVCLTLARLKLYFKDSF